MTREELLQRMDQLEAHVAHLERQADELNGVMVEQAKLLARLQKNLGAVTEVIESAEKERLHQSREKPPHYAP
jgi:uncharacterized coiled-coil protein SlyX